MKYGVDANQCILVLSSGQGNQFPSVQLYYDDWMILFLLCLALMH